MIAIEEAKNYLGKEVYSSTLRSNCELVHIDEVGKKFLVVYKYTDKTKASAWVSEIDDVNEIDNKNKYYISEVTREDWLKNPTPRIMWVWDKEESDKVKRLVVHCFTNEYVARNFVAEDENGRTVSYWKHCAEVKPFNEGNEI